MPPLLAHIPDEDPQRLAVYPVIEEDLHELFCKAYPCPCAPEIRLVRSSTIFVHHPIRN